MKAVRARARIRFNFSGFLLGGCAAAGLNFQPQAGSFPMVSVRFTKAFITKIVHIPIVRITPEKSASTKVFFAAGRK
jgi:hypothetical protein